jgi:hypothetical protein
MKPNTKPRSPTQRDAADFLPATKRLLKVFRDKAPTSDDGYAYISTMRTFLLVVRGIEEAKTDPELAAAMKLSIELLRDLELVRLAAANDATNDEPDYIINQIARAEDLVQLIDELETIHDRERE